MWALVIRQFTGIVILLRRPGSVAVQQTFFEELDTILDRIATYQKPIHVVGDFNIRLDRLRDPHAAQLRLLVDWCSCH
jgi:endonuclease/exonuclease/phosphatase (EEP) superfamily protein YafD